LSFINKKNKDEKNINIAITPHIRLRLFTIRTELRQQNNTEKQTVVIKNILLSVMVMPYLFISNLSIE